MGYDKSLPPALVAAANLAAAAAAFQAARVPYVAAARARAIAAFRAKEAGATYGDIAAVLRVPRNNLPALVRLGARLAGGNALVVPPEPLEVHAEAPEESITPPTSGREPVRCPSCKRANDPGASRCVACGWRL